MLETPLNEISKLPFQKSLATSDGEILYNVISNQNQNPHTKKDLKSKSKSYCKNVFQIKIQSYM